MRDFIEVVLQHFTTNSVGVGYAQSKDVIFEAPDNAIAVYETLGLPTARIENARIRIFQVVVRSTTYENARTISWDAFYSLRGTEAFTVIDSIPYNVVLMQSPFKMKIDESQRVYFAFNFLTSVPL